MPSGRFTKNEPAGIERPLSSSLSLLILSKFIDGPPPLVGTSWPIKLAICSNVVLFVTVGNESIYHLLFGQGTVFTTSKLFSQA